MLDRLTKRYNINNIILSPNLILNTSIIINISLIMIVLIK